MTAVELLSEAVNHLVTLVLELRQEVSDLRMKVEVEKSVVSRLREDLAVVKTPTKKA